MFKSTNGGAVWSAVNTGLTDTNVHALAIDPATPSTLYAGTVWGSGVFKSTNGGAAWSAVNTGLTDTDVFALAIDPATPSTLYAGTSGGVFKSTNGGAAWSAVNTGLTATIVHALAIDPATPSTLYAGTGWRRRVQEHERRRGLECGQHRPDSTMFTPWRLTQRPQHALCGDIWGQACSRARTAAGPGMQSTLA